MYHNRFQFWVHFNLNSFLLTSIHIRYLLYAQHSLSDAFVKNTCPEKKKETNYSSKYFKDNNNIKDTNKYFKDT